MIPTTQDSDKQRIPSHALPTQPLSNLPGVAAQEDSVNLPSPIGKRIPGGWPIEGPVANSELPTDVVVSTAEEEGQYVVFVKDDGLIHLQCRGNIQKPSPRWEDSQLTPLEQGCRRISSVAVLSKGAVIPRDPETK